MEINLSFRYDSLSVYNPRLKKLGVSRLVRRKSVDIVLTAAYLAPCSFSRVSEFYELLGYIFAIMLLGKHFQYVTCPI